MSSLTKPLELDTNHLDYVDEVLSYCNFNKTQWFNLGHKLGLLLNTLKTLEATYKGDESRCLLECLNKWLSKADNVTTPTGKTLAAALRKIDEKRIADCVLKIMTNPASCLLQSIDLSIDDKLITQLQTDEIINKKAAIELERYGVIALCTTVADDHDKLKLIGQILSQNDDTKSIGENLLKEFDKVFSISKSQSIDCHESPCKTSQNQEQSPNSQTVESTDDSLTVEVTKKMSAGENTMTSTGKEEKTISSIEQMESQPVNSPLKHTPMESLATMNVSVQDSCDTVKEITSIITVNDSLPDDMTHSQLISDSIGSELTLKLEIPDNDNKALKRQREIETDTIQVPHEANSINSITKKSKMEPCLNFPAHKIRSYQKELARSGLEGKNYIICAPTGSGKTLIAALIIHDHLTNKKQRGKVLFVVRTQHLALQQTTKLKEYLNGVEVIEISGEMESLIYTMLPHVDIIVCTSGKLANELETEQFNISECSLLILDECHHTVGVDPYAIIMEHYLLKKSKLSPIPQVVGMTASPGAGRGKYPSLAKALAHQVKLCARLDATYGIKCIQDNLDELEQCVPKPSHESHTLPQRNPGEPFVTILTNAMTMLEELLPISCQPTFDRYSLAYQQWIKQEIEAAQLSGMEDQRDQISILERLEEYYIARITYDDFEIENAQEIIKEVPLKDDTLLNDTEKKLKDLHITTMRDLLGIKSQPNPLLQKAEELLYHHFSKKSESKALFFVRDIRHTNYVTEWIKSRERLSKLVRPCSISGYARKKLMTKEEQVTVVDDFRRGIYNLLVSTSVLEEGLDVPECNMVIRFQVMSNEVADIQAQGRARAEDSTMHTIITSDSNAHHNLLINIGKQSLAVGAVNILSSDVSERKNFDNKIAILQEEIIYRRNERIQANLERKKTWNPEDVNLCCYKCGVIACKAADVCKFGKRENPHYVVPLASFVSTKMKKVDRKGKPEPAAVGEFTRPFKIACKKCHEEWGIWGCWKNIGAQYPVLKCKSFTFHNTINGQRESGRQWKKAPFEILFYAEYNEQED